MNNEALSVDERDRYSRQITIDEWGDSGQQKLKQSTVFVAGCGGLGSPVLSYLAAAGVGTLRVCDDGDLELSNLNRQVLYVTDEIGMPKAKAASLRLEALNPHVIAVPINQRLTTESAASLIGTVDLIVDCLDNFKTRDILNQYSVSADIPLIHAGVAGMAGQIMFLHPPDTACLACVIPPETPEYETPPPVVGAAPGVLGALQAMKALAFITGVADPQAGKMTIWDGETGSFDTVEVEKDPSCPVCGSLP